MTLTYCCKFEENTRKVGALIEEIEKILDSKKIRDYKLVLRRLQSAVDLLQAQQKEHLRYRVEYARETLERVKEGAINVGPLQRPLQTRVRPQAPPPPRSRKRQKS